LPGDTDWELSGTTYRRTGSPVVEFGGASWEEFFAGCSRNVRQDARWRERMLVREYDARFHQGDPGRFESDFDTLLALHDLRWRGASLFSGPERAFQREFARLAADRGWLRLWFLELNGKPAAAWYGFRFGNSYAAYQSGRDPAFERLSLGTALDWYTIRVACEEGASEYRYLRGGERYKYRFATNDPGLVSIAVARGVLGRSLLSLRLRFRENTGDKLGLAAPPVTRSGDVQDHPSAA
jgi:CelD/BcsL family acetyltransferase involved in cellulose biosynthesis